MFEDGAGAISRETLAGYVAEASELVKALPDASDDPSEPISSVAAGSTALAVGGAGGIVQQALARSSQAMAGVAETWILAETVEGHVAGTPVALDSTSSVPLGSDRGVHHLDGKTWVFIRRVVAEEHKVREIDAPLDRVDCRTLPPLYDSEGSRHREFHPAILCMRPLKVAGDKLADWPVGGPLTVVWLLLHMFRNGGSAVSFHSRWLSEVRLDYGASGCSEHLALCKFFDIAVSYDQLDVSALACCELLARRLQMIHEKWKHKLPMTGIGATGAQSADDDSHLLMGTAETRGNVGVCPALTKWMGDELSKEALATKERRKAREERALASKASKAGPQGSG